MILKEHRIQFEVSVKLTITFKQKSKAEALAKV